MRVLARKAGLSQKLKVPKWVCRSPLAVGEAAPTRFAIFGPARGQIFGKKVEKNSKNWMDFCLFWIYIGISVVNGSFSVLALAPHKKVRCYRPPAYRHCCRQVLTLSSSGESYIKNKKSNFFIDFLLFFRYFFGQIGWP